MSEIFSGKTVLLTGPTSGIGLSLARKLAAYDLTLILVSRNIRNLEKLKNELSHDGNSIHSFACDLSKSGAAEQLLTLLKSAELTVDIFINNAGFGVYGKFADQNIDPQIGMIECHVTNPTKLSHAFLPHMNEVGGGILTIGSTAAFQPVPFESIYGATKTYALHFFEGLAEEYHDQNVVICCFCPGPTDTAFFDAEYMRHRGPAKRVRVDADLVAEAALKAYAKKQPVAIQGFSNKVLAFGTRLAPRSVVRKAARQMIESIDKGALD